MSWNEPGSGGPDDKIPGVSVMAGRGVAVVAMGRRIWMKFFARRKVVWMRSSAASAVVDGVAAVLATATTVAGASVFPAVARLGLRC